MTHPDIAPACPPEVLDWLAWYPTEELPEPVRGAIDAHAAQCAACRDEIAMMQATTAVSVDELPDPEAVFARVRERIAADAQTPQQQPAAQARRAPRRSRPVWASTRRSAIAAAAALFVVGGLGGASLVGSNLASDSSADARYLSASESAAPTVLSVPQLDVVFRPDVPFRQIHAALNALGASVVAGPTRAGVMRLHLPAGADAVEFANRLRTEMEGVALFAEPVLP